MRHRTRVLLSSLFLLLMAGSLPAITASPAAAQEPPDVPVTDLLCTVAGTSQAAPGITLLGRRQQQFTGHVRGGTAVSPLTPCTSVIGLPYQGFTMEMTGSGAIACGTAGLGGRLSGRGLVTWDNGDTSIVDWRVTLVGLVPVVNVTITGGALTGTKVIVGVVPTSFTGNCVVTPLTGMGLGGIVELVSPN